MDPAAALHLGAFDYELPAHLIAQEPSAERDQSSLLVVKRAAGTFGHHRFSDLPDLLAPGDLLVLNDSRVLPARLLGRRSLTGGKWEGLFLRALADGSWELLCQTRGHLKEGETILVDPGPLRLHLLRKTEAGLWVVRASEPGPPQELLERHGQPPLPPYIRKGRAQPADRDRYQTIYARLPGAVAAPTAGLHFSARLFERLRARGVGWTFVTLHVGLGTFQPIQTEDLSRHQMHREWGALSAEAAAAIVSCKKRRKQVVAVGTTCVRLLESVAAAGPIAPWSGETGLFIFPPYAFQVVDALVTNFHLPRTTLLLLVSAFAGAGLIRQAYQAAIEHEYRFFSYGDAMLIL